MAAPEEQPINGDGAAAQEQQPADGEQVMPAHMSLGRGALLLLTGQHDNTLNQHASLIAPRRARPLLPLPPPPPEPPPAASPPPCP